MIRIGHKTKYLTLEIPEQTWVLDIECDGLDPTQIWVVVVKNFNTGDTFAFRTRTEFKEFLAEYGPSTFIGHNILSFDVPQLNRLWHCNIDYDSCIDTLVLSYLYNPAMLDGHSLDAWGARLKFPKTEFSDWSQYSSLMEEYCRNDVELTLRVYKALRNKMNTLKYSELSCTIEHKIRVILDRQEKHGFWFDKDRAFSFRSDLRQRQSSITEQIQALFPPKRTLVKKSPIRYRKDGRPFAQLEKDRVRYQDLIVTGDHYECYEDIPFNLGSPKQRVERLLELGWEPEKFTEKGFPKVDEEALVAFAEICGRKEVQALSEWLVLQGRASMLDTWFNNLGSDSRIHGKVITCGAQSRRMIHNSPNTANIPSGAKAKYGKECRSFWGVEPGRGLVLVGYDASGLETAGLCHYLNNSAASTVLLQPKPNDVHTKNAVALSEALGWPCDREWAAKTSWYAWLYGAYPPKLGSIVGASKNGMKEAEAGEIVIDTFFRNVPGLKKLIDDIKYEWKTNSGRLITIDGGFVVCPNQSAALNYKIQSCGSILMKYAAIILDEQGQVRGIPFNKVADIHDEGQLETEEEYGEQLGKLTTWSIEEAGRRLKMNVPVTGDYRIGTNWSMTH